MLTRDHVSMRGLLAMTVLASLLGACAPGPTAARLVSVPVPAASPTAPVAAPAEQAPPARPLPAPAEVLRWAGEAEAPAPLPEAEVVSATPFRKALILKRLAVRVRLTNPHAVPVSATVLVECTREPGLLRRSPRLVETLRETVRDLAPGASLEITLTGTKSADAATARVVPADADAPAPRGPYYGPDRFALGANLPWLGYGGDFGANAWRPQGGVAAPDRRAVLEETMARLAGKRVRHVRWFMFCDGRAGVRFGSDGTPLGLDEHVLKDADAAVETAQKHGIRLTFVLLDFHWLKPARQSGDVQLGGHRDTLSDDRKRQALIRHVFRPVLARYGDHPAVAAWDLINEPEWGTFGAAAWNPLQAVSQGDLRAYVREAAAEVHAQTRQQVTVGLASAKWLTLVRGLGLDFYQVHWYDHFEAVAPLGKPVEAYRLDRPLILGEYPTKGSKRSAAAILDTALEAGFGGAWAWGVLSTDTASAYADHEAAIGAWAARHADRLEADR